MSATVVTKVDSEATPEAATVWEEISVTIVNIDESEASQSDALSATTVTGDKEKNLGEESRIVSELRDRVSLLKRCHAEMKSALVTWNRQTKQMFSHPSRAIEELTRQIKNHWSIPRKIYWLQVTGKHESQIHDWPAESSVFIKVRGLGAGRYDDDESDAIDDEEMVRYIRREKHPKGVVRLSIGGRVVTHPW
jgi:hypothetical protein